MPLRALRTLAKEVRTHCLRDQHQIKEELTTIEQTTVCSTPEMKRRLVDTLISVEVPGMEAHTLLKKKDTPPRLLHFFFKKLVEKKYLSEETTHFLQADRQAHIPFLRQLLAQHQNAFNTVVETLEETNFVV